MCKCHLGGSCDRINADSGAIVCACVCVCPSHTICPLTTTPPPPLSPSLKKPAVFFAYLWEHSDRVWTVLLMTGHQSSARPQPPHRAHRFLPLAIDTLQSINTVTSLHLYLRNALFPAHWAQNFSCCQKIWGLRITPQIADLTDIIQYAVHPISSWSD